VRLRNWFALALVLTSLVCSLLLVPGAIAGDALSFSLDGPLGLSFTLSADALSVFMAVVSSLVGALIMAGVANGLNLMNSDQPVKYMVQGIIVLLAVSLDTVLRRRQSRGRQLGAATA